MIISTNSGNALPVRLRSIFTANKSKWSETGHLNIARLYHAASLLLDGKVLVTGGEDYDVCSTAELYDPISRNWTKSYDMTYCRWFHTATTLKNGKVLIAGGAAGEPEPLGNVKYVLNQAELYETSTGYWFHTTSMNIERYFHTASLLQNGNVLVVGGSDDAPNSAEVYEPEMETWINTTDMHYARKWHTETVLKNGQVLVTGGHDLPFNTINSAEIYDPSTNTWKVVGSMNYKRYFHTATLLTNGKVLVAGGLDNDDNMVNSTELFDPSTESWTITGNMTQGRYLHTASLLKSGKVLVSGGGSFTSEFSTDAELYDFSTGMWTNTSSMNYQRASHTATVLADGNVLVIGGKPLVSSLNCTQYSSDLDVLHSLPFNITIANGTTKCTPRGPCATTNSHQQVTSFDVWNRGPQEALQVYCLTHLRLLRLQLHEPQWHIPTEIGDLTDVMALYLENIADGSDIPETIGKLTNLEWLSATAWKLTVLPDSLGNCKKLRFLSIAAPLKQLPISLSLLPLANLWVTYFAGSSVPQDFFHSLNPTLKTLRINISKFESFDSFSTLTNLEVLEVVSTGLMEVPVAFNALTSIKGFHIAGKNNISRLSEDFPIENLERLLLENNCFTKLPVQALLSRNLEALELSGNRLVDISEIVLAKGPLQDVRFSNNKIETLPETINKLGDSLQSLYMNGNRLRTVPAEELVKMKKLRLLDISNNQISDNEKARLRTIFAKNPSLHVQF
ncbi:unnamed protein product [Adineta steineri]|uniref:Uncharacterized protein n=1 Tax=Adineta steineri TaxID=433720 RepID=A0A819BFN9_9BILA|nr:unnamed protein product [Adineta steineri]CAF3797455.1 unnamed protein product [Adineta steineri]